MPVPERPTVARPSNQYIARTRKSENVKLNVNTLPSSYDSIQSTRELDKVCAPTDVGCGFWCSGMLFYLLMGMVLAVPVYLAIILGSVAVALCTLLSAPACLGLVVWFRSLEPKGDPYWAFLLMLQRTNLAQKLMAPTTARQDFPVDCMRPKRTLRKVDIPFTGGLYAPVENEEEFMPESGALFPGLSWTPADLLSGARILFLPFDGRWGTPTSFEPGVNPVAFAMKLVGSVYPTIVQDWSAEEKQSDEGLARFCRDGIGAHRVERVPDGHPDAEYGYFVLRTNALAAYETRPGLATYGGDIYFDSEWKVTCIVRAERDPDAEWWRPPALKVYRPGSAAWVYAKFCARSSVLSLVTMIDHLYNCHWHQANTITIATREQLSPTHPVRRFLVPFQFFTISINKQAVSGLAAWMSTVPRLFAFTRQGLASAYADAPAAVSNDEDERFGAGEVLRQRAQTLNTPYHVYACRYYEAVEVFVTQYLDTFYPSAEAMEADAELAGFLGQLVAMRNMEARHGATDKLDLAGLSAAEKRRVVLNVLSSFVFHVTMLHEQVGSVQVYVQDVSWASFHWKEDETIGTKEAAYGGAILMALTSTPMPKLMVTPGGPRDWTFLFPAEGDTLKALQGGFADFQSKLVRLASDVEEHNKVRPHEAVFTVNPRYLETSVSV